MPTTTPMTSASDEADDARAAASCRVAVPVACRSCCVQNRSQHRDRRREHVLGFHPRPHDELPDSRARSPIASSFGHAADQTRRAGSAARGASSSVSSACELRSSVAAQLAFRRRRMTAHLLPQSVGDRRRRGRDLGRVDAARPRRCRRRDSATTRPGRLESSTTRSPSRTASRTLCVTKMTVSAVSRQSRSSSSCRSVAGHGVERAERLVHEQDVGVLGKRAGERDPLAHAARELVGPLARRSRSRCTISSSSLGASSRSRLRARRASFRASSTLPRAVSHGNSAASWNMSVVRVRATVDACPTVGCVEPGDEVEQRALAATRRAERGRRTRPRATSSVSRRARARALGPVAEDLATRRRWTRAERRRRRRRAGVEAASSAPTGLDGVMTSLHRRACPAPCSTLLRNVRS